MSRILQSTPLTLARCTRCGGYVLAGQVGGLKVAADPEPLGVEAYREALIAGITTYRLVEQGGRPWKLDSDVPHVPSDRKRLAAHDCGCIARDAVGVEEVPEAPQAPVCDTWRAAGWNPPSSCPRRGADPATGLLFGDVKAPLSCRTCEKPPFDLAQAGLGAPESLPRSQETRTAPEPARDPARRRDGASLSTTDCHECGRTIRRGEPHVALHHGRRLIWLAHSTECPE